MSMLATRETSAAHSARSHVPDEPVPEFDALYRRHFRYTWSVLRRLGVPESAIEDAAQEVWVIVHRRLDALESPRAAQSWLFQIARRVAARHRRGEQRSRRKIDALGWAPARRNQPHADRDSWLTVETLLGQLDARKREAFVLSELEGWSAPEIAKSVGTNPNTVYSRIRLAREELRAGWDARCPEHDLDVALAELHTQTRPPKGEAKRAWLLLAPKLALGSKAAVTGIAAVASWKLAIAGAALLGLAALGGTVAGGRRAAKTEATHASSTSTTVAPARPPSAAIPPASTEPAIMPALATPPTSNAVPEALDPTAPLGSRAASSSRSRRASAPEPSPGLEDETGLLATAQTSLAAGQPARAIAQLTEHRKRFTASPLADLRTLLELKALCALDRTDEAAAKLRDAESTMPGSALLPKMRQACGT